MKASAPTAAAEIPFLKERLLALGSLALLAPIPLFFSNALELAVLLVYLGVLALLLMRVRAGTVPRLGNRALNLAGLLYFPVLVLDVRFGSHTLLKTMLHLLLFTLLFKLAAIRKERDLSLALVLSGMLFVASVSTAFHWAILLYVLLVATVGWSVLVKWALWRDLSAVPEEWSRGRAAHSLPGRGPLVSSVMSAVLLAVPLFLFLPRRGRAARAERASRNPSGRRRRNAPKASSTPRSPNARGRASGASGPTPLPRRAPLRS